MQVEVQQHSSQQVEHQLPQIQQAIPNLDLYKQTRNAFIRKLYTILTIQLLIASSFITYSIYDEQFAQFQVQYLSLRILSFILALIFMILLITKRSISEVYPINMVILISFTLCYAYFASSVAAEYQPQSVLLAAIATGAGSVGLTLYISLCKIDFSQLRQSFIGIGSSLVAILFFLTSITFFLEISAIQGLISFGVGTIYSIFLVLDTQLILNNAKHNISVDQYVLASIYVYVDIVSIFLDILRLIGKRGQ